MLSEGNMYLVLIQLYQEKLASAHDFVGNRRLEYLKHAIVTLSSEWE